MLAVGFHPDSARIWGAYNSNFDFYQNYPGFSQWKGIGYLNFSSYYYLAEARGDTAEQSAKYSAFYLPGTKYQAGEVPALYAFLAKNADTLGFNPEAVEYFLKIANSAEFSVPLVEIHGTKDSLVPTIGQGVAYRNAVEKFGNPGLHRLYLIENGVHVEYQADALESGTHAVDYDFNKQFDDSAMADELTPMQGYAMLAMDKLEDWVENGIEPVESMTVETDPLADSVLPF